MDEKVNRQWISYRFHVWDNTDKLIQFMNQYKKTFMVLESTANREHIQGLVCIESSRKMMRKSIIDKFRIQVKKSMTIKGNKDYSLAISDGDQKHFVYLCKGDGNETLPKVLENNYLTEKQIQDYHKQYWEKNAELKRTDGNKKWYKIREYQLPKRYEDKCEEIKWYMKIVLYHNANDLLIPDNKQIQKMIRTYTYKESENPEEKAFADAMEWLEYKTY